jgi:outer membrane lipoprotein carrier protein
MAIVQQSGQFYLKRPDLFRWQTIKPNQQIIYGNVQQMIVYDPDLMQATVHPVTPQSWTPAQLLLGDTKMMERYFNVTLIVHNAQSIYYLKAKDKRQAFQSATLMFQDKKLSALNIKSNLDQYSEFRFSNIKINQPIANSFFKFKAKSGVDVIHG